MTTITIHEDLGFSKSSFSSIAELISYLKDQGVIISLCELSHQDVSDEVRKNAHEAKQQFLKDPDSFEDL